MTSRDSGPGNSVEGSVDSSGSGSGPTLPAWKAFTVQFSLETGGSTGMFAGRIEHLNTGRRARFVSAEELVDVLHRMLADIEKTQT